MLSACKTPPIPPESPKPPPSVEQPPKRKDASERTQKPPLAGDDSPDTRTDAGINTQQQNDPMPLPVDQGNVAAPSQTAPGSPQDPKPAAPTASPEAAQTDTELTSDMDRTLQESLSEFDEQLLRDRKLLLQGSQDTDPGLDQSGGAIGDLSTTGDASAGDLDGTFSETRAMVPNHDNPPETSAGAPGKAERGGIRSGSIPPDIPDGRDDDIVARQIREAAMSENDPELRKKLWQEYKEYKKSNSAQTP